MISRTVVAVEPMGQQVTLKLDDAPLVVPGLGDQMLIDLASVTGATSSELGCAVLALLNQSDAIRQTLTNAFAAGVGTPLSPLYFHIRALAADSVPWELLRHEPGGFCALDPGLPIGRIATSPRRVPPRPFQAPLQLVAVLSAAGRTGMDQLTTLMKLVASPAAAELDMHLHVISGEEKVLAAATGPRVTSELIATSHPGLARQIAAARPHLLHVLCHGGAVAGARVLSFAHFGDFEAGSDVGSVPMSAGQFAAAIQGSDSWLVVLSACQTADGANGPALANSLVSEGVPAVIGMRRLVDLSAMDRFCDVLYPEILALLARKLASTGEADVRVLEWAPVLTAPRQVLAGADPTVTDTWSDPVLYCQERELQIFLPSPTLSPHEFARLSAQRETFAGVRARLDPKHTPPDALAELDVRIAELTRQLHEAGLG